MFGMVLRNGRRSGTRRTPPAPMKSSERRIRYIRSGAGRSGGCSAGRSAACRRPQSAESLGRSQLRLSQAAGVKAADRIEQLIKLRPPWPVLQGAERLQQAADLGSRAVRDAGDRDPARAHGAQRAQVEVGASTVGPDRQPRPGSSRAARTAWLARQPAPPRRAPRIRRLPATRPAGPTSPAIPLRRRRVGHRARLRTSTAAAPLPAWPALLAPSRTAPRVPQQPADPPR